MLFIFSIVAAIDVLQPLIRGPRNVFKQAETGDTYRFMALLQELLAFPKDLVAHKAAEIALKFVKMFPVISNIFH